MTLTRQAKVLTIYYWSWSDEESTTSVSRGTCRTTRDGAATSGEIFIGTLEDDTQSGFAGVRQAAPPVVDVQGPLPTGTYRFGLQCSDVGNTVYWDLRIAAVVMGTA